MSGSKDHTAEEELEFIHDGKKLINYLNKMLTKLARRYHIKLKKDLPTYNSENFTRIHHGITPEKIVAKGEKKLRGSRRISQNASKEDEILKKIRQMKEDDPNLRIVHIPGKNRGVVTTKKIYRFVSKST